MSEPSRSPSPCIGVCRVDEARSRCIGCLRTLDEIAAWPTADAAQRAAILDRLAARRRAAGLPDDPVAATPRRRSAPL